ncbi:hypothetical protein PT974_04489 [Cladobotryum mycophilum]|uniref:Uncharacterized protein n=1 Tax=Cladobotryum mycophilum TaxID=491253 RepID=A0ABR0SVY8_9HYPO
MLVHALTLGLAGLAIASPAAKKPPYTKSQSKGFFLGARASFGGSTLNDGYYITAIGTNGTHNFLRINDEDPPMTFYQTSATGPIMTDTDSGPLGLTAVKSADDAFSNVVLQPNGKGISISAHSEPFALLAPGVYFVDYADYADWHYILRQAPDGTSDPPGGLAAIMPECTDLDESTAGSQAAVDSDCYANLKDIDWWKYRS